MPRRARVVFPGVPHHVTQRGNHRERVFFESGDPEAYLSWLCACSRQENVEIVAYCLMPNHVHLIVIPSGQGGLHHLMMSVNGKFAQRINRMRAQTGHLWQGRYFSSPLDETYFLNAIRYVELNPVRAGLTSCGEEYRWSSAASHCGHRFDPLLRPYKTYRPLRGIADWSQWLASGLGEEAIAILRKYSVRNLPCGSPEFIERLEKVAAQDLRYRSQGGQRKTTGG